MTRQNHPGRGRARFVLTIACDNAAFSDGNCGSEIAAILRDSSDSIARLDGSEGATWALLDSNGNSVGRLEYRPARAPKPPAAGRLAP